MRKTGWVFMVGIGLSMVARSAFADLPEIKSRGTLRVLYLSRETTAHTSDRARRAHSDFFSVRDGAATGFDAEVLQRFCKIHALRMVPVGCPNLPEVIAALLSEKGDVIVGNFTATESRRAQVEFTVEVLPTRFLILTRKPHRVIERIEQLREEKVGILRGTSIEDAAHAAGIPAANLVDVRHGGAAVEALRSGAITALVMEIYGALIAQNGDRDLQFGTFLGDRQSIAYAVRKNQPLLLEALNDSIRRARSSPLWSELVAKYFGDAGVRMLEKARE